MTERRIDLLARRGDFALELVRPNRWADEFGSMRIRRPVSVAAPTRLVPVLGRPNDPHRMLYGTLSFGLRSRPDLIHAEEEPDSLAALQVILARARIVPDVPLVLRTWQNVRRPMRPLVRWVFRRSLRAADAIVCANHEARQVLRDHGYTGVTAVFPSLGVDPSVYYPRLCPGGDRPFTVISVGRLVPEKGVDILIAAFARLAPPARLVIVGQGPSRARLEAEARQSGIGDRVEFTGALSPDDIAVRLSGADVFVMPSRTLPYWKEQFGRALTEAMACRVAVVASDSGAIPEVIGDAGVLVPEGDPAALAEALVGLRAHPERREDLAARGQARAEALFTPARMADQAATFYHAFIDRWRRGLRDAADL